MNEVPTDDSGLELAANAPRAVTQSGEKQLESKNSPTNSHTINKEGEDFIKFWERRGKGPASTVYTDASPTIGYGHHILKGEKTPTQPMSRDEAQKLFEKDMRERVNPYLKMVKVPLTQSQVNALADYIYNGGNRNFVVKVLPYLNAGFYNVIPSIIASDIGALRLPGNIKRRRMEADLF